MKNNYGFLQGVFMRSCFDVEASFGLGNDTNYDESAVRRYRLPNYS